VIGIYSIHMYIYIHIHVCSVAVRTTLVHLVQIPNIEKCIQPIFRCLSHDMHVQFGFQFSVYFRVWKVVEPTHCQDDTHKSIRELHLSFHFID